MISSVHVPWDQDFGRLRDLNPIHWDQDLGRPHDQSRIL
jgi:hypothetical protein